MANNSNLNDPVFSTRFTKLYYADCLDWLKVQAPFTLHGVVTDPPYGLVEYTEEHLEKRKNGKGGIWRIPPSMGNSVRQPLPRFTVLGPAEVTELDRFFHEFGITLLPILVPGAHVVIASNPLLSDVVAAAMRWAGFEKRGEIIRTVRTLRGGDRPKGAENEFADAVSLPRSCWEPWLLFRKPFEGTLANTLRKWGTGALRRLPDGNPFSDLILSGRTPKHERVIAPHPSIKPQSFLRQVVRAMLPLAKGTLLDPFAGSGSTLAAAEALGYKCVGVEKYEEYINLAKAAIPLLADLPIELQPTLGVGACSPLLVDSISEELLHTAP